MTTDMATNRRTRQDDAAVRRPQLKGGLTMNSSRTLAPTRVGGALALTGAVAYAICAAAFAVWPDGTLDFFNALFHGVDLAPLKPGRKALTLGVFVYGLVGIAVAAFLSGVVYAVAYNLLGGRAAARS
jgi:hypothetical protein